MQAGRLLRMGGGVGGVSVDKVIAVDVERVMEKVEGYGGLMEVRDDWVRGRFDEGKGVDIGVLE